MFVTLQFYLHIELYSQFWMHTKVYTTNQISCHLYFKLLER